MSAVVRWGREIWDFVVGDDWRLALASVIGIAIAALLSGEGIVAWWVLPVVIPVVLLLSLRRASRRAGA